MNFGDLLDEGRKRHQHKQGRGHWGRCEYCDEMLLLFEYKDAKEELWQLCDGCINIFVEEENEDNKSD